jgi:hypothetical protein
VTADSVSADALHLLRFTLYTCRQRDTAASGAQNKIAPAKRHVNRQADDRRQLVYDNVNLELPLVLNRQKCAGSHELRDIVIKVTVSGSLRMERIAMNIADQAALNALKVLGFS